MDGGRNGGDAAARRHVRGNVARTGAAAAALAAGLALAGCDGLPDTRPALHVAASPERGLALVRAAGCAACHDVPGVEWPKGRVGPPLAGFASRALIAGARPNRPDELVAWLRDPWSVVPGSAMPPTPLPEAPLRDVAAYLLTLDAR